MEQDSLELSWVLAEEGNFLLTPGAGGRGWKANYSRCIVVICQRDAFSRLSLRKLLHRNRRLFRLFRFSSRKIRRSRKNSIQFRCNQHWRGSIEEEKIKIQLMKWKKIASVTECCNIFLLHKKIWEKFSTFFAFVVDFSALQFYSFFFVSPRFFSRFVDISTLKFPKKSSGGLMM